LKSAAAAASSARKRASASSSATAAAGGASTSIDGSVAVTSRRPLRVGDVVTVRIDQASAYDLTGTAV